MSVDVMPCISSSKELHRQVGVGMLVKPGSLGGVMVRNARDVGSIPTQGEIFPIFIIPYSLVL